MTDELKVNETIYLTKDRNVTDKENAVAEEQWVTLPDGSEQRVYLDLTLPEYTDEEMAAQEAASGR